MATTERHTFCRMCAGNCSMILKVDDNNEIVDIRGNHESPLTRGYACFKGLQSAKAHREDSRLLRSLKRQADGSYTEIPSEQAFDEIAEKLAKIIERDGPNAVACYNGTGSLSPVEWTVITGFLASLGSHQFFTTMTIDQSAKQVSLQRLGAWRGGSQQLADSDVAMFFGANPLVSHSVLGLLNTDPTKRLKEAKANGLALIVVDPRKTETARHADVFLQPLPGFDAHIAAAMLNTILKNNWHDQAFCSRFVGEDNLASLQAAVSPFSEEWVENIAGLQAGDIYRAAKLFAVERTKGIAATATGTCLSPFSNVARHMVDTLNVICGRFPRVGDPVPVVDVINPDLQPREGVIPPGRSWKDTAPSRIRGEGGFYGQRMTGTLADEILTPGQDQIKCMIVDGANPGNANPDQQKMAKALKSLELLVTIDPFPTVTANISDYIIAPRMQFEKADLPPSLPGFAIWPISWTQYAEVAVEPPEGSDVVQDWYVYWSLAKRLGKQILFRGKVLDMEKAPSNDELLDILCENALLPLAEIKQHKNGYVFSESNLKVRAADEDDKHLFDVMPDDVEQELKQAFDSAKSKQENTQKEFPFLLASRRMRDIVNSGAFFVKSVRKRIPLNPAYLHPEDMDQLGLNDDDEIEIRSKRGKVSSIAKSDKTLRPGVISLPHSWGGLPDEEWDWREFGSCVNMLTNDDHDYEAINAMPHLSAIPVAVERLK